MKSERVLLVTGASSDIGAALIGKIAANYSLIWAHYCHSKEPLERLCREIGGKIVPIFADFSDENSTANLIKEITVSARYPDHIIHLPAPGVFNQRFHKCSWPDYQAAIDVSLRSIIMILESFVPPMLKKKYGKIEFMLSSCVIGLPPGYQSPYITAKYALLGLMRGLAVEYAGKGITVNAVSPDMMETKFLSNISDMVIAQNAQNSPLRRNLTVDDVVPAFEFLLSDETNAMTGQNLAITGGIR